MTSLHVCPQQGMLLIAARVVTFLPCSEPSNAFWATYHSLPGLLSAPLSTAPLSCCSLNRSTTLYLGAFARPQTAMRLACHSFRSPWKALPVTHLQHPSPSPYFSPQHFSQPDLTFSFSPLECELQKAGAGLISNVRLHPQHLIHIHQMIKLSCGRNGAKRSSPWDRQQGQGWPPGKPTRSERDALPGGCLGKQGHLWEAVSFSQSDF